MLQPQDLICFRHCGNTIFVRETVSICPLCSDPLSSNLESPPLTLSCPFVRASQYPAAIVLRPSSGDFLCSFQNQHNLHIAVTSVEGDIVEYDIDGLTKQSGKNNRAWDQCLLIAQVPEGWYDRWDEVLAAETVRDLVWTKDAYQEQNHNCYSFVLSFLRSLEYNDFSDCCHDKLLFSEKFIVPKTKTAAKYITIHRKLQTCPYWIEKQV
ncbi:MKRN2 opposite strand protein [Anopheles darlingi]|uniref:MKRN2 opposite strand protein n=1 Tax=Anopheles darlingi TaxID=43151 RepID=UPI0021002EE4|nr:MKRN2 opposite strand protein [Anopheles darlingi]